jgi:hypothetical protein
LKTTAFAARRRAGSGAGRAGAARLVIRVLLADDQPLVRAGFRVLIDSAEDLEVVGEAADGAQAVAPARQASDRPARTSS